MYKNTKFAQEVMLPACIQEASGSNLCWATNYDE
jgi:hypothetical protein